jgi:hypothetical protein
LYTLEGIRDYVTSLFCLSILGIAIPVQRIDSEHLIR